MKPTPFFKISEGDVVPYQPDGHTLTLNRRLAGRFNGSQNVEFIIGEMARGGGAQGHMHEDMDQMIFLLEGKLRITSADKEEMMLPGDLAVMLKGTRHEVWCEADHARFIIIYSPARLYGTGPG